MKKKAYLSPYVCLMDNWYEAVHDLWISKSGKSFLIVFLDPATGKEAGRVSGRTPKEYRKLNL